MATINSTIKMSDKASGVLSSIQERFSGIINKANQVNSSTNNMSKGIKIFPNELQKAQNKYNALAASQDKVNAKIEAINNKQKKLSQTTIAYNSGWLKTIATTLRVNRQIASLEKSKQKLIGKSDKFTAKIIEQENEIKKLKGLTDKIEPPKMDTGGGGSGGGLFSKIFGEGFAAKVTGINQALELTKKVASGLGSTFNYLDQLTQTKARIDLINDGLNTTEEMQTMIYEAANRSRGSYQAMSSSVAKLGLLAKDSFSSNKEIVAFTELLNKSFTISGAGAQEASSAMYQLTQAMASGKLQGDEFRSIMENAPMLADAIAEYTGKSKGELKEMSSEGKITADVIKNAMFSAADDINAKFDQMPMTFSQAGQKISNAWDRAMQSVSDKLTEVLNNEQVQQFLDYLIVGIENIGMVIVPVIETILNVISNVVNFIVTNWSTISTVLMLIGMVMLPMIIAKVYTLISALVLAGAKAVWAGIKGFVSAMLALGPVGLIIMAILAVIAILKLLGVSFETVFGFIGGVVGVTVGIIMNIFIGMYNLIADIINGISYGFEVMAWGIKKAIATAVNWVLDKILSVAKIIDKVFGSDLSSGIQNTQKKMNDWAGDMPEWHEVVERQEYVDLQEAWNKGSDIGKSIGSSLDGVLDKAGNLFGGLDLSGDQFDLSGVIDDGAMNTHVEGGQLDDVNISDEDLKMLKDIATRDYMLNYKQVTPNVNITFGDVRETADMDQVRDALTTMMQNELSELYVVEEG